MTDPPTTIIHTGDRSEAGAPTGGRRRPLVGLVEADQAPLLARPYFADGDPGPIIAALAQVPEMLEATVPFLGRVLGPSCLPARIKEIVILRTSARASCRYCIEAHTVVARDVGLSVAEVRALRAELGWRPRFPIRPSGRSSAGVTPWSGQERWARTSRPAS